MINIFKQLHTLYMHAIHSILQYFAFCIEYLILNFEVSGRGGCDFFKYNISMYSCDANSNFKFNSNSNSNSIFLQV